MSDDFGHLAKDCPRCIVRPTQISTVKGSGSTKVARGRGSSVRDGGREAS